MGYIATEKGLLIIHKSCQFGLLYFLPIQHQNPAKCRKTWSKLSAKTYKFSTPLSALQNISISPTWFDPQKTALRYYQFHGVSLTSEATILQCRDIKTYFIKRTQKTKGSRNSEVPSQHVLLPHYF